MEVVTLQPCALILLAASSAPVQMATKEMALTVQVINARRTAF